MTRAERERAQREGVTARTLIESDFLLGTRDDLRQGVLPALSTKRTVRDAVRNALLFLRPAEPGASSTW